MLRSLLNSAYQWLLLLLICPMISQAQELSASWTFQTDDKVLASPVSDGHVVYIGGQDGTMYALNAADGKLRWSYATEGNIQAQALLTDKVLFFESANLFYALDPKNGELIWNHDPQMEPEGFEYEGRKFPFKLDFWDDKRSAGCLSDGVIYIGGSNGHVYGFQEENGELLLDISSEENSPIRSTPLVENNVLYFGDWEGVVYAYNLKSRDFLWSRKTYRGDRLYPSFGGISASFLRYKDLLIFGARNHQMNVLYAKTGEKEWTYADPKGGWMVGDPVIFKDTLYIGGSDNFSMYALGPKWGRLLWQHNGGLNIYSRPVVTQDHVFYTAGNAYNWTEPGLVYVLRRSDGEELVKYETPKPVFSSPVTIGDKIIFGCYDGNVYALDFNSPTN